MSRCSAIYVFIENLTFMYLAIVSDSQDILVMQAFENYHLTHNSRRETIVSC